MQQGRLEYKYKVQTDYPSVSFLIDLISVLMSRTRTQSLYVIRHVLGLAKRSRLWAPRGKHDNRATREQSRALSKVLMPNLNTILCFSIGRNPTGVLEKQSWVRFQHRNSLVLVWSQGQMRTGDWEFHLYITMTTTLIKIRWEQCKCWQVEQSTCWTVNVNKNLKSARE